MIQFFLMLFGLAFSNNNANAVTTHDNNPTPDIVQIQSGPADPGDSTGGDTGGETGQTPPPKK
ncbi:hypothetical protein [Chryseobacterium lactis]|uniref:hypothetical protein n=2 Tax=Chryseobacterium lactis TaxID=1241981 RepID=UPI0016289D37|nr:hypothetical protein [Chryseobacterium lactis]